MKKPRETATRWFRQAEHSVAVLARQCAVKDNGFSGFIATGTAMDQYDVPTRYPDALADPAVPFESYTADQAQEAVRLASEILEMVRIKVRE